MDQSAKTRKRRIVIQRKVSSGEYEKHKERMESMGLDPSDPAPVGTVASIPVETMPTGANVDYQPTAAPGALGQTGGRELMMSTHEAEQHLRDRQSKKMVSLQRRTIEEQIQHGRHERALARFAAQQQKWESFRHHASSRTGRHKDELVVTRAEEHRERKELMEVLDRATPEEGVSGGFSWYHSLRGEGTRFVTIGNMFSGLHLPLKMHKENYVAEIVRKPHLRDMTNRHRELRAAGKKLKSWRDDEYLIARMKRFWSKVQEHQPGNLDLAEMLEPECVGIRPPGEVEVGELEAIDEYEDDAGVFTSDRQLPGSDPGLGSSSPVARSGSPLQGQLKQGPHIQALPEKLQFHADVKKLNTQCICLKNVGTAVIQYEWVLNENPHGFQESVLPDDPTDRFMCHTARGTVLPGLETQTLFTFTSSIPGVFTSSWCLSTYPELIEPISEVWMHGMAVESDLLLEQRRAFEQNIHEQQVLHQVQELIDDVFETVKLQPAPLPDLTAPLVQERLFEEYNASLGLHWSPHAWNQLCDIRSSIDRLRQLSVEDAGGVSASAVGSASMSQEFSSKARGRRPVRKPPPEKVLTGVELGVPSAEKLSEDLREVSAPTGSDLAKDKRDATVDLARAVRAAQVEPLERSALWWLAYETVLDIATAVPDMWAAARKAAELEPLPFLVPLDDEVVGVGPEAMAEYERQREERQAKKADEEKEVAVKEKFIESFEHQKFGPCLANFANMAHEASTLTRFQQLAPVPMKDRLLPYLGRHNTETVDIGANVILYEVDLGFLASYVNTPAASDDSAEGPPPPVFNFFDDAEEQAKQRMSSITPVLEGSPLAVIIIAHIGKPSPERMQVKAAEDKLYSSHCCWWRESFPWRSKTASEPAAGIDDDAAAAGPPPELMVAPDMRSLVSLEPLTDLLREATEGFASAVEFVPHHAWLGDPLTFAERVRSDSSDNKVFLLENMAAFPEELGIKRFRRVIMEDPPDPTLKDPPPPAPPVEKVDVVRVPWVSREAWAARAFASILPDFFVQDSFASSCHGLTLSTGLWPAAPQRIFGPSIDAELNGFMDALKLQFLSASDGETPPSKPAAEENLRRGDVVEGEDIEGDGEPAVLATPLLIVLGGGGFGKANGEAALLRKLELLVGLAHLTQHEKDGLLVAVGGELAVCVLTFVLGIRLGTLSFSVSPMALEALKTTMLQVLQLGVTILLPSDLVCEDKTPKPETESTPPPDAAPDGSPEAVIEPSERSFTLNEALAAVAKRPISLGFVEEKECFASIDVEQSALKLSVGLPQRVKRAIRQAERQAEKDGATSSPQPPEPVHAVPAGWTVTDIGEQSVEGLRTALRRSRGVLWNGSLGIIEEEKWQRGTRAFLAAVARRILGPEEEEEEEEGAEAEEEDEEGEGDADAEAKETKEEKEPEVEFEVSIVIGRDSVQMLPSMMETPGETPVQFSFVSQQGEAFLQLLRGRPLPGLLACAQKDK